MTIRNHLKYLKEKEILYKGPILEPNYNFYTSCKNLVHFIGNLKQNKQTRVDKDDQAGLKKIQIEHKNKKIKLPKLNAQRLLSNWKIFMNKLPRVQYKEIRKVEKHVKKI